MYHLLTGDEFDAEEAYHIGLVQEVVPAGSELDRAIEIAERIASQAPLAVQATKASARRYMNEGVSACIAAFGSVQAVLLASDDAQEGTRAFVERRATVFTGK